MRAPCTVLVVAALLGLTPRPARALDVDWEYHRLMALDFIPVSLVGMPYRGNWRVSRPGSADAVGRFEGVNAGALLGAGWGLQLAVDAPHQVRIQLAAIYHRGAIAGSDLPLDITTVAEHGEASAGIGWQRQFGRLSLHTITTASIVATSFQARARVGAALSQAVQSGASSMAQPFEGTYLIARFDLRAGQQVGLHVAIARSLVFYADAQLDTDLSWFVRLGLGIGGFGPWQRQAVASGRPVLFGPF